MAFPSSRNFHRAVARYPDACGIAELAGRHPRILSDSLAILIPTSGKPVWRDVSDKL